MSLGIQEKKGLGVCDNPAEGHTGGFRRKATHRLYLLGRRSADLCDTCTEETENLWVECGGTIEAVQGGDLNGRNI